jgi:hypothetical protein
MKLNSLTKLIPGLCVLLSLTAFAVAQGEKWLPPAMADIGLTAEQKDKIKPVVLEMRKQSKALREDATLDAAAKQEKLKPINKTANDQFKAIMTPEQWTQFEAARKALNEKNKAAAAEKKP